MSLSDDVREYCRTEYVEPARQRGELTARPSSWAVHWVFAVRHGCR
jgi:hypothetical protein